MAERTPPSHVVGKLSVEDNYDEFRTDWCSRHRRTAALAVPGLAQAAIEHPGLSPAFLPEINRQKSWRRAIGTPMTVTFATTTDRTGWRRKSD